MMLDDSMKSLLDEFVTESKEHLSSLEEDFLSLEKQKDNPDSELVNKVFRAIHTIKGTSGFFGFEKITELAHSMENILSLIRSEKMKAESHIIDNLLTGADLISMMVDDVESHEGIEIGPVLANLKQILESDAAKEDTEEMDVDIELKDLDGNPLGFTIDLFTFHNAVDQQKYMYRLEFELSDMARYGKKTPVELIRQLLKEGSFLDARITNKEEDLYSGLPTGPIQYQIVYSTSLSPSTVEKKFRLGKECIIRVDTDMLMLGGSDEPAADEAPAAEPAVEEPEVIAADEPAPAPKPNQPAPEVKKESKPETKSSAPDPAAKTPSGAGENVSSVRIGIDLLDNLMRLASELVLVRNQQLRTVDLNDSAQRNVMQRLDIVTSEMQEAIMLTRMQPIGNIFNKFQRIVRELAKKLGKQIEISISGSEVELDKTILESLTDPLTHIIRNSCDHGIELPDERETSGKEPTGIIELKAYHEGGQINIEIRDDGKGINPEKIKEKALEKGLRTPEELAAMNDKEIAALVMAPGFSTADQLSDLSGRGVGMDVVKTSIERLSGSVDLNSEVGVGTTLHLRLPLTLAIIPCLVVQVGGERFALPQVNLEELVCLYDEDVIAKIECAGDREVYRLRDQLLPMVRLSEVLARKEAFSEDVRSSITEKYSTQKEELKRQAKEKGSRFSTSLNFAVLKIGSKRFGLIVDKVIGTEEIVVKPMHPALKMLSVYSGATVMGDGSVALILDVEGIARHTGITYDSGKAVGGKRDKAVATEEDKQTILLFKSGNEEQFGVALPLIRRIERINVANIEEIGGKDFITVDGISTRVLRLERVLSVSPAQITEEAYLLLPKHIKRPFGILATKLIDIEEIAFDLNTESYMDDGLLGTSIIRDHMTLFIDIYRLIELSEPDWFNERRQMAPPPEEMKTILLAEDSPFFRQLMKGYLEADGYRVLLAENGKEALELLHENGVDLIISDLQMPVMDGFEFIREVRQDEKYQSTYAIALTQLDSEEDKVKAFESGFDKYEVKIERELFLTAVSEMIHQTA